MPEPNIPKTAEIQILAAGDKIPQLEGTPFYPITESHLEQLALDYNPGMFEAPVTLDHEQSGPSYGWVERLERRGAALYAHVKDLAGELVELVRSKRYKKISAEIDLEFYKTGKPYIKGFSFLGAGKPAVAGMADPVLSESGSLLAFLSEKTKKKIVCTPDRELYDGEVAAMPEAAFDFDGFNLPEFVQDEKELEYLTRVMGHYNDAVWKVRMSDRTDKADLIRKYTAQLQKAVSKKEGAELSEKIKGGTAMSGENKELEVKLTAAETKLVATEAELAKLREINEAKEKRLAALEQKNVLQSIDHELTLLVKEGKLTPAERKSGNLDALLACLPDSTVKLGEKELSLRDHLLAFFKSRPQVVDLSGRSVLTGQEDGKNVRLDVMPKHLSKREEMAIDENRAELASRAKEIELREKKTNPNFTYRQALVLAEKENPHLVQG